MADALHSDVRFARKVARVTATLADQFAESAELEKAIRANLRGLGHAI